MPAALTVLFRADGSYTVSQLTPLETQETVQGTYALIAPNRIRVERQSSAFAPPVTEDLRFDVQGDTLTLHDQQHEPMTLKRVALDT